MLKELRYRFRHDHCWLQQTTERYPSLTLVVSSIYDSKSEVHVDLTVHGPDADAIEAAEKAWREDPRIRKVSRLFAGPRGIRYHVSYEDTHSILPDIMLHTPISLGTISIAAGTEHYTVVGEAEDIQRLIAVLAEKGDVKVESIKSMDEFPAAPPAKDPQSSLLDSLTDKQLEALLVAFTEGYYRWPRTVSASTLALRMERSSSAFLAHLRQAESKVLEKAVEQLVGEDPGRLEAIQARLRPPQV